MILCVVDGGGEGRCVRCMDMNSARRGNIVVMMVLTTVPLEDTWVMVLWIDTLFCVLYISSKHDKRKAPCVHLTYIL